MEGMDGWMAEWRMEVREKIDKSDKSDRPGERERQRYAVEDSRALCRSGDLGWTEGMNT